MATKTLTKDNFHSVVRAGIVLVDFWAPWCGPCRAFAPAYEQASTASPDVVFGKVNTEEEAELADTFRIRAIPTLMAFRDGLVLYQQAGGLPAHAIARLIEEIRKLDMVKVRAEATTKAAAVL